MFFFSLLLPLFGYPSQIMSTIITRQERTLGLLEKYQTSKQLTRAYGNISMTALLEHDRLGEGESADSFYLRHFQPALTRLVETHPGLSVVVKNKDESTAHFEQLTNIDLSKLIQVTTTEGATSLQALVKEQTSVEFDLDALLPLWRLKVVPTSATNCMVALGMHHIIGDGMSLTIFYQDFLQALNNNKAEENAKTLILEVKEKKLALPYELSGAPTISVVMDVLPVFAKSLIPKILPTSLARFMDPMSIDGWKGDFAAVEGESHNTEAQLIHVPLDIWKPITNECKKRGISAHAIVFSVMLLAWQRLYPGQTTEVSTPINCRGLCNPPVSNHQIGNYVGGYTSSWTGKQLQVAATKDIWELATKYHQDLQSNKIEAAKQTLFLKYLPEFPASYCDFWYDKRRSSSFGRTGGLELSDLGKLSIDNKEAAWKVNQIYFCQSAQTFTTAFGINSISCNDNLYCTMGWQKGALDTTKMNQYHDVFIGILKTISI